MDLDATALDDVRDAWRAGRQGDVRASTVTSINLGACFEAACWAASSDAEVGRLVDDWASGFPPLRLAHRALTTNDMLPRADDHEAPPSELRRCPSRGELVDAGVGVEWNYFLDRFRRSLLTKLGVSTKRAWALSAALKEMVDNVVEHAGLGDAPTGIVAYEVSTERFSFAVADLGRGALASLRENPAHATLKSDADSLKSAVTGGASRRPGPGGKGFADLLRALADLQGVLTFRSGSARLRLDGRGTGPRRATTANSPQLLGFQLYVDAQPKKSAW